MSRIKSLDLARGFVVLLMAPVHTMLMYSQPEIQESFLGKLLAFFAEWHGAQIFMLIMGISFAFSKNQSFKFILVKAFKLLAVAYGLNIFKFVIPHFFGWLPSKLLLELQIDPGLHGYIKLFLLGDILQFASIALVVLVIVFKCTTSANAVLWLSIVICFAAPLFWDADSNRTFVQYLLNLIGGQPPRNFFPLFPWLIYPLLGFFIGRIIHNQNKRDGQKIQVWVGFDSFWIIGFGLIIVSSILKYWQNNSAASSFYRTSPIDSLLHVGAVLVALSIWNWISNNVKTNAAFKLFSYSSIHITRIYIIQWILIFWLLPVIGYQKTGLGGTIVLIFLTSAFTLMSSLFIDLEKSQRPVNKI